MTQQIIKKNNQRIPPNNIDSERALLGSIMLRPEAIHEIMDIIKEVEGSNKVTLIGFYYFGNKVMGAKDGKLKTIEDVSDKFDKALDELDANPDVEERIISFWFNIK